MNRRRLWKCKRLFLAAIFVLVLGVTQGLYAQNPVAGGQTSGAANTSSNDTASGAPKGCKAGQMQCLKNNDRWQAAIRNADRQADKLRKKGKGK